MSCLREVQTISKSPHILPMPSLTRLTTGGVLNPLKNTTNTSHNELLHQDPLQPPLEPRIRVCACTGFALCVDGCAHLVAALQECHRFAGVFAAYPASFVPPDTRRNTGPRRVDHLHHHTP